MTALVHLPIVSRLTMSLAKKKSMIEAAMCMFHKLLGEASDDLERVTPQSRKSLHIETIRNAHRCSRSETASEKPCSRSETLVERSCSRLETLVEKFCFRSETPSFAVKLEYASKTQPSRESLEQVADNDFRKQLELSVPLHKPGEWKYEFKMSSFTSTMLNLLFAEAERKGKTRHLRTYIGPGSDGSSADKLSLDLKSNPWDTAITFRPEWRSMSKTVFAQYDPSVSWYTEQNGVWLDDVKTFYHRPMRCVIVVHPYFLSQRDTDLSAESAYLSCAKICIDDSRFSPDLYKDKRVTLNKRQKNEISNSAAFFAETNQVMWNLLTNTIPHGRTIVYTVTPATEASMMAVGHFTKIFDPGKNASQLTGDSVMSFSHTFHFRMMTWRDLLRCVRSKRTCYTT